ncbi:MAG: hypothetical protein RB294_01985 [Bacteroidales bacterium]|nr:hypothetical protein [Bacteroidales bacterium]
MIPDRTETHFITAPMRSLKQHVMELDSCVFYGKWRWFQGYWDAFSWVYRLSEEEIRDFMNRYEHARDNIQNIISVMENGRLKDKLTSEYRFFPESNAGQYVNSHWYLWLFYMLSPIKKIRKTHQFKRFLDDIASTSERMINYTENAAWLEMVPEKEDHGL